jgi:cytochrome P450
LAKHPEWQDKVRAEMSSAGFKRMAGGAGQKIHGGRVRNYSMTGADMLPDGLSFRGIEEFKVLSAVVMETLRLYPSAGFTRVTDTPFLVKSSAGKEIRLPPKTEIFFFPNIVHQDPARVPDDPMAFRPDRWLQQLHGLKSAYFPFSMGARNCVGERLALAEVRVALAMFLTEFEFKIKDGPTPRQILLMTMQPHQVQLEVTPIKT